MSLTVEDREIVVPGQTVAEGMDLLPGPGTYREDENIYAKYVGLAETKNDRLVRVIQMNGKYQPNEGDLIIGCVERVAHSRWILETNTAYDATLPIAEGVDQYIDLAEDDLHQFYDIGDALLMKVQKVTKDNDVQATMTDSLCRKLEGGRIIEIPPAKVPRVIGKEGSMIDLIKDKTGCNLIVGQNGRIWLQGGDEDLAVQVVRKVEENAHTAGLTDQIKEFLNQHTGDQ